MPNNYLENSRYGKYAEAIKPGRAGILLVTATITIASLTEIFGIGLLLPIVDIFVETNAVDNYIKQVNKLLNIELSNSEFQKIIFVVAFSLFFFAGVFQILTDFLIARLSENYTARWQQLIFRQYLKRNYQSLVTTNIGDLLQRQMVHTERAAGLVIQICHFVRDAILAIGIYILLLTISLQYTLIITILIIFVVAITLVFAKKRVATSSENAAIVQARAFSLAEEVLSGLKFIRAYGAGEQTSERFDQYVEEKRAINVRNRTIGGIPNVFLRTISLLGILVLLYALVLLGNTTAIPEVVVFGIATFRVNGAIGRLNNAFLSGAREIPSMRIVATELSNRLNEREISGLQPEYSSEIMFKDVSFAHAGERLFALKKLDITINQGSFVGIVGPSGSGKTTIIDLLMGFYGINSGEMLIDGKNFSALNINQWREMVGYVGQDVVILSGTIAENILFYKKGDIDKEKLYYSIEISGLGEFVNDLPSDVSEVIGPQGLDLSGGQRQRLAIARAVYRDPQIFLFDEATSNLDPLAGNSIHGRIHQLCREQRKTIVSVAHRVSILRQADEIYVLSKGNIVEHGTHQQLMTKRSVYCRLFEQQTAPD